MNLLRASMTKGALLTARSTGNASLLAWFLGTALAYALIVLVLSAGIGANRRDLIWLGMTSSKIGLSLWQAVLLLPSWWRRLGWILIFYFVSLAGSENHGESIWRYHVAISAIIQSLLLVGTRQWVWSGC